MQYLIINEIIKAKILQYAFILDCKIALKYIEYIIDSTKIIRDILYLAFSSFTLFYIYYFADYLTFVFSLATSVAIYFAVHDVYSIYFNAILQSKINAYCNILALIIFV
ncbi:putative membrane protein, partial [Acinetobacter baumannii 6112]